MNWQIILAIVLFGVGLLAILKGGDFLVDSAIWIAKATKIPPVIIGATIVSIATTLPEVLVSCFATASGPAAYGIAVGNAVGSMICNVALISGLTIALAPGKVSQGGFISKAIILLVSVVLLFIFSFTEGVVVLVEAIILLIVFVFFMGYNLRDAIKSVPVDIPTEEKVEITKKITILRIGQFLLGALFVGVGAKLLVDNGLVISDSLGISSELMGLTFVAVGTSLPELVTSMTSLKKGTSTLGLGNIVGANIINSTLLVGLCGIIAASGGGLTITVSTLFISLPVFFVAMGILLVPLLMKKKTYRFQGIIMLALYVAYILTMIFI